MTKVPRAPSLDHLKSRSPAIKNLPAGTRLWRIYFRGGAHPTRWSEFRYVGPLDNRFDHHAVTSDGRPSLQEHGVLYAADHPTTCLAEVYQKTRTINRWYKEPWLVGLEITESLELLDLTGAFPTQSGASMGLMSTARSVSRRWAQGYYAAYPGLDGLYYPSSMHANQPAVALNEHADARRVLPDHPLYHRALRDPAMLSMLRNAARAVGYDLS